MEQLMDRRSDPRVRVQVRISLVNPTNGRTHVLTTTNLSAGGACCTSVHPVVFQGEAEGTLALPFSEGGREVEVALPVRARIIRCAPEGDVVLALAMTEAARDDLRRFLLDSMAEDCVSQGCLVGAVAR